ncbi:hypothetical protein GCM10027578_21650 [Spirosoma luteolum]
MRGRSDSRPAGIQTDWAGTVLTQTTGPRYRGCRARAGRGGQYRLPHGGRLAALLIFGRNLNNEPLFT